MKLNKSSREWTHYNLVCADAPYLHITDSVKHVESFDMVFTPPDVYAYCLQNFFFEAAQLCL